MAAARQRPALAAALAALAALLAAAAAAAQQVEAPAAAGGNRSDVDVEDPSSEVVDVALAPILGALLGLCLRAAAAGSRQQQRPAVWCWAAAVVLAAAAVLPGVAAQAASAPSEPLPTQAPGEALTKPAAILGERCCRHSPSTCDLPFSGSIAHLILQPSFLNSTHRLGQPGHAVGVRPQPLWSFRAGRQHGRVLGPPAGRRRRARQRLCAHNRRRWRDGLEGAQLWLPGWRGRRLHLRHRRWWRRRML